MTAARCWQTQPQRDMYDLENIQAFVVANGAEHTIRDYSVSIYKDKENGGLEVGVTGQSFRK